MPSKQIVILSAVTALLSAGLGVVIMDRARSGEPVVVKVESDGRRTAELAGLGDRLAGARVVANEAAAIATLRTIASAQAQIQAAAVVDTDGDVAGEYAYLGELAGTALVRTSTGRGRSVLEPALLPASLGAVDASGIATRSGYHFRVYLPGASSEGAIPGLAEASGVDPDPDAGELLWCAYAWPVEAGVSGRRAFFVSQEGECLETANADGAYSGRDRAPAFDAALCDESPGDMASLAPLASLGEATNDGRAWSPLDA